MSAIHSPHGMMRSICVRNSFFFVRTCASSSLSADRLICLSMRIVYHILACFALCGIALIVHCSGVSLSLGKQQESCRKQPKKSPDHRRRSKSADIHRAVRNRRLTAVDASLKTGLHGADTGYPEGSAPQIQQPELFYGLDFSLPYPGPAVNRHGSGAFRQHHRNPQSVGLCTVNSRGERLYNRQPARPCHQRISASDPAGTKDRVTATRERT